MIGVSNIVNRVKGFFGKSDDNVTFKEDLISLVDKEFERRQKERLPFE